MWSPSWTGSDSRFYFTCWTSRDVGWFLRLNRLCDLRWHDLLLHVIHHFQAVDSVKWKHFFNNYCLLNCVQDCTTYICQLDSWYAHCVLVHDSEPTACSPPTRLALQLLVNCDCFGFLTYESLIYCFCKLYFPNYTHSMHLERLPDLEPVMLLEFLKLYSYFGHIHNWHCFVSLPVTAC